MWHGSVEEGVQIERRQHLTPGWFEHRLKILKPRKRTKHPLDGQERFSHIGHVGRDTKSEVGKLWEKEQEGESPKSKLKIAKQKRQKGIRQDQNKEKFSFPYIV